jgi:hypothetical protein
MQSAGDPPHDVDFHHLDAALAAVFTCAASA